MTTEVKKVDDDRKPLAGFANYEGDQRDIVDKHWNGMGPNRLREVLFPVEATYDLEKDMTRVGFSYNPPANMFPQEG